MTWVFAGEGGAAAAGLVLLAVKLHQGRGQHDRFESESAIVRRLRRREVPPEVVRRAVAASRAAAVRAAAASATAAGAGTAGGE